MKHIAIARGFNEPDNNTPSDEIMIKVIDIEPSEVARYEKVFTDDMNGDFTHGVEVNIIPMVEDEWVGVATIW